jgi:nucleoside-diphosphate-sugar epimerase
MKITITGSLGNISSRLTENLITKGHTITVVTREKATAIEEMGAIAAVGSVEDYDFLVKTFTGADAVYTMVPPNHDTDFMARVSANYVKAIAETGVSHVVNLSSSGSALSGKEPLKEYHNLETGFDNFNVLHLRPGMFYTNFYGLIGLIKTQHIIGNNFDGTVNIPMTHPHDIADIAADALDKLSFTGVNIHYPLSDTKNGNDIARILGEAIREKVSWVPFTDEQLLQTLMQNGFPKPLALTYYVGVGIAMREGLMEKHYQEHTYPVSGETSFEEFAKEFAYVYKK